MRITSGFIGALALAAACGGPLHAAEQGGALPQPPNAQQSAPPVLSQAGFEGLHVMRGTPAYVKTGLGQLHFWSLGKGPAVVLLHQGPLFSVEFAKVQPLLAAKGFRTIAVDLPGFGFSERPDHAATGDEYADSLATLLDHLGIKQAAMAGSHTGATVALAFAARYPARTACLVLQSVPIYSPEVLQDRLSAPAPDSRIYNDGRQIQDWWQRTTHKYDFSKGSPESMQWMLIGTLLSGDFNWYGESTGRTFVSRAFDSASAVGKVKAPTLLMSVVGDHLEDSAQRAMKLRPDFTHLELADEHSIITIDHPQLWADAVGGFMGERCAKSKPGKR